MNLNEFKTMYSKREKHKTESVSLGKADIDVGIIPTINWLNSLKVYKRLIVVKAILMNGHMSPFVVTTYGVWVQFLVLLTSI